MKKGVAVAIVCVSILLLVSMPIVSANWFDDLLNNIADFFGGDAEIIDYGCGQGMASILFLDNYWDFENNIYKINTTI